MISGVARVFVQVVLVDKDVQASAYSFIGAERMANVEEKTERKD